MLLKPKNNIAMPVDIRYKSSVKGSAYRTVSAGVLTDFEEGTTH